ncbi:hypothetical protein CEX93_04995 [Xanthomonas euvesicatoria]|nr:hypothetical protein CEX93_04995 [Xanthomonas euvesicatoria]
MRAGARVTLQLPLTAPACDVRMWCCDGSCDAWHGRAATRKGEADRREAPGVLGDHSIGA